MTNTQETKNLGIDEETFDEYITRIGGRNPRMYSETLWLQGEQRP